MVKKAAHATLNRQLKAARLERGWSQQQVADCIGAPLSLIISATDRTGADARPELAYIHARTLRTKLLSPEELFARLSQRLEALTGGPQDLPMRQQTLRNTLL